MIRFLLAISFIISLLRLPAQSIFKTFFDYKLNQIETDYFEAANPDNKGTFRSGRPNNLDAVYVHSNGPVMDALLTQFEATRDTAYLVSFVKMMDNTISIRNDFNVQFADSTPTWFSSKYTWCPDNYSMLHHSGIFTFPMVRFAYLVRQDSALQAAVLPAYNMTTVASNPLKPANRFCERTLGEVADLLLVYAQQTLHYHDSVRMEWEQFDAEGTPYGKYVFHDRIAFSSTGSLPSQPRITPSEFLYIDQLKGYDLPLNMQNTMALTHMYLWLATGDSASLDKAIRLGNYHKKNILDQYLPGSSYYRWKYYSEYTNKRYLQPEEKIKDTLCGYDGKIILRGDLGKPLNNYEDISHAAINAYLPYLYHEFGLPKSLKDTSLLFDDLDAIRMANAVLYNMSGPHSLYNYLYRSSNRPELDRCPDNCPDKFTENTAYWILQAKEQPDIFHFMEEVYARRALDRNGWDKHILAAAVLDYTRNKLLVKPQLELVQANVLSTPLLWKNILELEKDSGKAKVQMAQLVDADSIWIINESQQLVTKTGIDRSLMGAQIAIFKASNKEQLAVSYSQANKIWLYTIVKSEIPSFQLTDSISFALPLNSGNLLQISELKGLSSFLLLYEKVFTIINRKGERLYTSTIKADWKAAFWGDFLADSLPGIVLLNNANNSIYVYQFSFGAAGFQEKLVSQFEVPTIARTIGFQAATAGHLTADEKLDLAFFSRADGDLYLMTYNDYTDEWEHIGIQPEPFPVIDIPLVTNISLGKSGETIISIYRKDDNQLVHYKLVD